MNVRDRVREYVLDYFYVSDSTWLTDETSLIETGVVDSTGMMAVILFLEGEFGIEVDDADTVPENLETISRICGFVERKRSGMASAAGVDG